MNEKFPFTEYMDNPLEYINNLPRNQSNALQDQIKTLVDEIETKNKPFWEEQGITEEQALQPILERTLAMTEMIKGTDKGKELLKNGDVKKQLNQTLLDMKNMINLVGYIQKSNEISNLKQTMTGLANEVERSKHEILQRLPIQPNTNRKIGTTK
jgi:vacuolar-type H+-ATPase catalytic subunit A/Vma1